MASARMQVTLTETAAYRRLVELLVDVEACAWGRQDAGLEELAQGCREDLLAIAAGAHVCVVCSRPLMCDDEPKVWDPRVGHAHESCLESPEAHPFFGGAPQDTRRPGSVRETAAAPFFADGPAVAPAPARTSSGPGAGEGRRIPAAGPGHRAAAAIVVVAVAVAVAIAGAARSMLDGAGPR